MPSTYTTNGGIEKIATGEQSGSWGDTTNTNFDILDRITNGVGALTLTGASSNLQTSDGALSDGQYKVLVLGGTPGVTHTITVLPNDAQKLYFVKNNTGQNVIFDQGSGSNVTVESGRSDIIYCDGNGASAAVVSLLNDISGYLINTNNLSDVSSAPAALVNLGLSATATELNYNDISTLGLSQANKVVTADDSTVVTFAGANVGNSTTLTSSSNIVTLDCRSGNDFSLTLSEAVNTFNITNPPASGRDYTFSLKIIQDGSGSSYSINWPTSIAWQNGNAPILSTFANAVDYLVFITTDGGTTYFGFLCGRNMET
jgi:hypothetical protein